MLNLLDSIETEVAPADTFFIKRWLKIFKPQEERVGIKPKAQEGMLGRLWNQITSWVSGLWQSTQKIFSSWENEVKPTTDEFLANLDQIDAELDAALQGEGALEATATILSYQNRRS
jgi:hypothetical protein